MNRCANCGRITAGTFINNKELGEKAFLPYCCSRCLNTISEEIGGETGEEPDFTCRSCKARVWMLRNKDCHDCYLSLLDLYEKLPQSIEEMDPPLGYSLIGCSNLMAKSEVDRAYRLTPSKNELEN